MTFRTVALLEQRGDGRPQIKGETSVAHYHFKVYTHTIHVQILGRCDGARCAFVARAFIGPQFKRGTDAQIKVALEMFLKFNYEGKTRIHVADVALFHPLLFDGLDAHRTIVVKECVSCVEEVMDETALHGKTQSDGALTVEWNGNVER